MTRKIKPALGSVGQRSSATSTFRSTTMSTFRSTATSTFSTDASGEPSARRPALFEAARIALRAVFDILRSSFFCSAVAWLTNFCCSQGQAFGGRSPPSQSYAEFMSAVVLWCQVFYFLVTLLTLSLVLMTQRITLAPQGCALTFLSCFAQLVRRTWWQLLGALAITTLVMYSLSFVPERVRKVKLELYFASLGTHLYTTEADLATRHIVQQERLRKAQLPNQLEQPESSSPPAGGQSGVPHHQSVPRIQSGAWTFHWRSYWRHYGRTLPMLIFAIVPGVFVQATTYLHIHSDYLVLFTCGGTLFKMCMQEISKWITHKTHVRDIRILCVAIAIPTVLIDTQIRLVLQRMQSAHATLSGTLLMGVLEILMRAARVLWYEARKLRYDGTTSTSFVRGCRQSSAVTVAPTNATPTPTGSDTTTRARRKVMALQSAEIYADMVAEYLAIGCSGSIMFFYGSHPKYHLATTSGGSISSLWRQANSLLVQLGVELVADFVACVMEIRSGVDFQELLTYKTYFSLFFANLAVTSVMISSVMYCT